MVASPCMQTGINVSWPTLFVSIFAATSIGSWRQGGEAVKKAENGIAVPEAICVLDFSRNVGTLVVWRSNISELGPEYLAITVF